MVVPANQITTAFQDAVSHARLQRYLPSGGSALDMVVAYQWNAALSEALYPGLAAVEVTLRSAIHREMTAHQGTEWWFRHLLEPGQLRDFGSAYGYARDRQRKKQEPLTAGHIVAELKFSLWVTMLSQPYNQTIWTLNNAQLLHAVFPHLPPTPNARDSLEKRYNGIRLLRNRVMHYEPVYLGMNLPTRGLVSIQTFHDEIIEAIGWVSPVIQASVLAVDRFDHVLNNKAQIETDFKQAHGIP